MARVGWGDRERKDKRQGGDNKEADRVEERLAFPDGPLNCIH